MRHGLALGDPSMAHANLTSPMLGGCNEHTDDGGAMARSSLSMLHYAGATALSGEARDKVHDGAGVGTGTGSRVGTCAVASGSTTSALMEGGTGAVSSDLDPPALPDEHQAQLPLAISSDLYTSMDMHMFYMHMYVHVVDIWLACDRSDDSSGPRTYIRASRPP